MLTAVVALQKIVRERVAAQLLLKFGVACAVLFGDVYVYTAVAAEETYRVEQVLILEAEILLALGVDILPRVDVDSLVALLDTLDTERIVALALLDGPDKPRQTVELPRAATQRYLLREPSRVGAAAEVSVGAAARVAQNLARLAADSPVDLRHRLHTAVKCRRE